MHIYQILWPTEWASQVAQCQCRRCKRHEFNPWIRKIPWSRKWLPTPVTECSTLIASSFRTDAEAEAPNTLATWCEEPTHWKRPWFWERLKAGGEGDDRVRDGWMASPSQWTWVWANSRRQWRTGKPGVLQSMGSQRAGHDWMTEQQPALVFLPGKFHGQRSLVGYSPWGGRELIITEHMHSTKYTFFSKVCRIYI